MWSREKKKRLVTTASKSLKIFSDTINFHHCLEHWKLHCFWNHCDLLNRQEFFVIVSCYNGMILFRIENRYCYGLNISGSQVHRLNLLHECIANRRHDLEDVILKTRRRKTVSVGLNNREIFFNSSCLGLSAKLFKFGRDFCRALYIL